jgi:hypothetical protein
MGRRSVAGMFALVRSIVSRLVCRFRSRAVELENLALRHQLQVLRRQRPGRLRLFTFDRLLWSCSTDCGHAVWSDGVGQASNGNPMAPLYLLRDRDASYGSYFCNRIEAMGIKTAVGCSVTAVRTIFLRSCASMIMT